MLKIEGWLHRHFADVKPYGNPVTDLRVNCPFCISRYGKHDQDHKLHVSLEKRVCHCFRCKYSRSWISLVMDATGVEYHHAIGELYSAPRVKDFDTLSETVAKVFSCLDEKGTLPTPIMLPNFVSLPDDFILLAEGGKKHCIDYLPARGMIYMRRRGFNERHWRRYGIGVAPSVGYRVIIPIEGDLWQARAIFHFTQPKYIHPSVPTAQYIFNWGALDLYDEVVICEGAFSAMAVGPNAIGLLRNKVTGEQLYRLTMSDVEKFVVALDSDAKVFAMDLAKVLSSAGKEVELWLYHDGDPADNNGYVAKSYNLKTELEVRLSG